MQTFSDFFVQDPSEIYGKRSIGIPEKSRKGCRILEARISPDQGKGFLCGLESDLDYFNPVGENPGRIRTKELPLASSNKKSVQAEGDLWEG